MRNDGSQSNCPSDDIAAYLDGELTNARELELDVHFGACSVCREELNSQKQFLRGLEWTLQAESEIELPSDFTRHLVANAESSVTGLRRPRERFNALFICFGLGLFGLFALGADAERLGALFGQITSVAGIVGHLVYSIFLGVAIIVRSLAAQVEPAGAGTGAVITVFVLLTATLWLATRTVLRMRRA